MTGDSGNDRRGLNMILIRNIKFHFPLSISKQKEIVQTFYHINKNLENLEKKYLKKLNNLEELKKSILQKAFAGELTS